MLKNLNPSFTEVAKVPKLGGRFLLATLRIEGPRKIEVFRQGLTADMDQVFDLV